MLAKRECGRPFLAKIFRNGSSMVIHNFRKLAASLKFAWCPVMWSKRQNLFHFRHWRVGEIDLHQADAHHPRLRLLGRGQARLHQTRLSKHLHGDAEHDPRHGDAADLLRERGRGRSVGGEDVCLSTLSTSHHESSESLNVTNQLGILVSAAYYVRQRNFVLVKAMKTEFIPRGILQARLIRQN